MQKSFSDAVVTKREGTDGDVKELKFRASRDEFRHVVGELTKSLSEAPGGDNVRDVRPRSRNPVVIMPPNGRVYLYYNKDGKSKAVVNSTESNLQSAVKDYFNLGGNGSGVSGSSRGGYHGRSPSEPDEQEPEDLAEYENESSAVDFYDGSEQQTPPSDRQGVTTVNPPFSKQQAGYVEPDMAGDSDMACSGCVHYADGDCLKVEGGVNPNAYCEELYADFGVFGRANGPHASVNLTAWGDDYRSRLSSVHIEEIVDSVKSILREKLK